MLQGTSRRALTILLAASMGSVGAMLAGCKVSTSNTTVVHRADPSTTGPASGLRVETTLYLGLGLNAGGTVAEADFQRFIDAEVMTRFPDGFTIVAAQGAWREGTLAYREPSRMLIVLHDGSDDAAAKIEAIRAAYKVQFKQTAVLRVDAAVLRATVE